jgi:uncharacterized protein YPO0396
MSEPEEEYFTIPEAIAEVEGWLPECSEISAAFDFLKAKLQAAEARASEAESALAEAMPIHNAMTERAIAAEARADKAEGVVKAAMALEANSEEIPGFEECFSFRVTDVIAVIRAVQASMLKGCN